MTILLLRQRSDISPVVETEELTGDLNIKEIQKKARELKAVAFKSDLEFLDINSLHTLPPSKKIELITTESKEGLEVYRHSTAHILAHSVKELFPDAKIAIGPAIEDGFYYDFDVDRPFTNEDLIRIEKKMRHLVKQNRPFARKVLQRDEAIELFTNLGETYKVEILEEICDDEVSVYEEGGFTDLCRGPHIPSTGMIQSFKLLKTAGAYWRGNEKNRMLQRIYGTSFPTEKKLGEYIDFLEEVKKRDHRRIGKELDLFSINEEIGPGLILWHPNGAIIRKTIEDLWRDEHLKAGYQILYTPHIAKLKIWERSGHLDFYRENMYSPMEIEGADYEIKPMNCPFHISIYKSSLRSYRDFPIRYAELGTVYRYERSGVLHGLLRVRGFTQDDAHIFCREDQIDDEILKVLDFTLFILKTFGFRHFDVYLSTKPEKHVGSPEDWEISTNALKHALHVKELKYEIDPGEGVFYGPKIDIKVKDSLGRQWQCSTIQVDFNNPQRFNMVYRDSHDSERMPIMIHRALMGSLERFFGILIEHYAGSFPLWLAPLQISLLTIAERHNGFAGTMLSFLKSHGIRAELSSENEKIGYKIRQSTLQKIPYSVIIGDKEVASGDIMVRERSGKNRGPFTREKLLDFLKEEIDNKDINEEVMV